MGVRFNPQPKKGIPQKKPKAPLKRTRIKYKKVEPKEHQSMLKFFIDIWGARLSGSLFIPREYINVEEWRQHTSQHRVDCITYEPIHNMIVHNFMHVLTKRHTKWKYEPKNICMGTMDTHHIQEFMPKSKLIEHGPGGKWFLLYQETLKSEYESLTKSHEFQT